MTHTEFKKIFLPLQSLLFREAMRLLCDSFEAEDAVQNLYLRLWEKREELDNLQSPEAYCRTVLRNICIDRLRRISEESGGDINELQVSDEQLSPFEKNDERRYIELYLSGLPPKQRKIVQLRMSGHSYEEIEKLTGLSNVNIRVIITRIRKQFREYYKNK